MQVTVMRSPFRWIHLFAVALAVVMLPWSTAFLSIAQMLLSANWLAEGIAQRDLVSRFKRAFSPGPVLVFVSFLGLHALGLLWTSDLDWGLDLCRILVPVLVFGVVLGESPRLTALELRTILLLGAWSVVASSLFCWITASGSSTDYRALSRFISHIRMALLLALAAVLFLYYGKGPKWLMVVHGAAALGAVLFIGRLGSLQALLFLGVIAVVWIWRSAAHWSKGVRWSVRAILCSAPLVLVLLTWKTLDERYRFPDPDLAQKQELTAGGEVYVHAMDDPQIENGTHIWTYVAKGELERTWPLRSDHALDGPDGKGHLLFGTLVRYLASAGLRKDSVAVMSLSPWDIGRIEQGMPSILSGKRSRVAERIDEVAFELAKYRAHGDANGHSVTMRLEYLKVGWHIARQHWLLGVGTGDTQRAFDAAYESTGSSLLPEWRNRAHNEYLTLLISFGVFGLLWSLFTWIWPAGKLGAFRDPLFIAWGILFTLSCLTDDTIETQAGATFFALYYALFVFAAPRASVSTER